MALLAKKRRQIRLIIRVGASRIRHMSAYARYARELQLRYAASNIFHQWVECDLLDASRCALFMARIVRLL
ncbi:MAG TPA: hypothetical protein VGF38_11625, partial [Ktedonobacterales bacterium]